MKIRSHSVLTFVIILCSAVLAAVNGLRLLAPEAVVWIETLGPGIAGRMLPDAVGAAIGVGAGLAGVAVGLLGQAEERAAVTSGAPPSRALRAAAAAIAIVLVFLTPGGLIPVAGYTFAAAVLIGVCVLTVLLVRRHPWWALALIAVLLGLVTWAVVRMRAAELASSFGASIVGVLPGVLLAVAHLLAAVALIALAITRGDGRRGVFARWVLKHRRAITIVAACCAVPYTFARLTWLTPWPLLAPEELDFATMPMVLLTGLSLGAAMLAGGLLTLGLILPWGRRFPRWMAGVGGRPVPISLAVAPASVVAALFTAGGIDLVLSVQNGALGDGSIEQVLELVFVFPFWLWGPLLALATWGYAMARLSAVTPAVQPETVQ
jgi:hypothetical protein